LRSCSLLSAAEERLAQVEVVEHRMGLQKKFAHVFALLLTE